MGGAALGRFFLHVSCLLEPEAYACVCATRASAMT